MHRKIHKTRKQNHEDNKMMTLIIPDEIEQKLKVAAKNSDIPTNEFILSLLQNALKQQDHAMNISDDDEALLIHEQLMEQYADAFQKLAQ
jgi:hypothetical protein